MRCHNDVPMYAMLAAAAAAGDENDNDRTENCAGAWRSATNVDDGRVQSVSTINAQPIALCRVTNNYVSAAEKFKLRKDRRPSHNLTSGGIPRSSQSLPSPVDTSD